jgi:hypothetical protein
MYENRFYFIFSFYKGQGNVCAKCRLQKVKRGRLCGGEAGMREREKVEAVWRRGGERLCGEAGERERRGRLCGGEAGSGSLTDTIRVIIIFYICL